MNDDERRMREARAEVDRRIARELARDRLDAELAPTADAITGSIIDLAKQLSALGLTDADNLGTVTLPPSGQGMTEGAYGIEADHPDDGKRLYTRDGIDTIIATRVRADGRYEHAVLDEHGLPIEWRTAYRPDLN